MKLRKDTFKKYKIAWVFFAFLIWMAFFDSNSLWSLYKIHQESVGLRKENEFYKTQIEDVKHQQEMLFSNKANLERFAREKYLMKDSSEDIFIIIEK